MRDKTYHAYLDSHERQLVIHSLVDFVTVYSEKDIRVTFKDGTEIGA